MSYRSDVIFNHNFEKPIIFQALEWQDFNKEQIPDEVDSDSDLTEKEKNENIPPVCHKYYTIRIFGVTEEGYSVCLEINKYTPYFYIKVPNNFNNKKKEYLLDYIEKRLKKSNFRKTLVRNYCILEKKKDYWGFTNNKLFKFIRLVFTNSDAMKFVSYFFNKSININLISSKDIFYQKYESNVDQIIRFIHTRNLKATGWLNIEKYDKNNISKCQIDIKTDWFNVNSISDSDPLNDKIAPLIQASFDIECYSYNGVLPSPKEHKNHVITIATAFKRYTEDDFFLKHVITLKKSNELTIKSNNKCEVKLECYNTEKEVLIAWKRIINKVDPDIIYTYNGDQFDCNYLMIRAGITKCKKEFSDLSKIKKYRCDINQTTFKSGAYGQTDFNRLNIPGRINFDLIIYMRRGFNLDSYKLDNVAEKFLGEKKHDVSPRMIFEYFESNDPEKIRIITEYCIQDTLLPQRIVDKLDIIPIKVEMSKITYVPIRYLIERGQQIKVFSQIVKRTKESGFLIPHKSTSEINDEKFQGATVLNPEKGSYWNPISTLDFASLYPSIMMAHNFCYSSLVMDSDYDNLEDIEYFTCEWKDDKGEEHKYKFAQNFDSILPVLLSDLYKTRKQVKKMMKTEKNNFKKSVLNGRQLAIKVSMNSVYGFLAAQTLQCKPIAACVTTTGRQMIEATKNYVENEFTDYAIKNKLVNQLKTKVVYGDTDSVFVSFKTEKRDVEAMKESFYLAEKCAEMTTNKLFKEPIKLEFEKVYSVLILLGKKMYIGALHETSPEKMDYIDKKGVALKRRDNCNLVKKVYQGAVDIVMEKKKKGVIEAVNFVKNYLNELNKGNVDFDDLVITKRLRHDYKSQNVPHLVLSKKIGERDPEAKPKSGDRVPYIFIDTGNKKHRQFEKVEDPNYARENKLKIDTTYYIEKQLKNPICQFFSVLVDDPNLIFKKALKDAKNKKENQREITDFFK